MVVLIIFVIMARFSFQMRSRRESATRVLQDLAREQEETCYFSVPVQIDIVAQKCCEIIAKVSPTSTKRVLRPFCTLWILCPIHRYHRLRLMLSISYNQLVTKTFWGECSHKHKQQCGAGPQTTVPGNTTDSSAATPNKERACAARRRLPGLKLFF